MLYKEAGSRLGKRQPQGLLPHHYPASVGGKYRALQLDARGAVDHMGPPAAVDGSMALR